MVSRAEAESVVALLQSTEPDSRRRALDQLSSWQRSAFDVDAARVLLAGAAGKYADVPETWPSQPNESLVNVLWSHAQSVAPSVVAEYLPRLPGEARWAAIRLLAEHGSEDAVAVVATELRRLVKESDSLPPHYPILLPLERHPRHAGIVVPALLELLVVPRWMPLMAGVLLPYATAGLLDVGQERAASAAIGGQVLDEMEALRAELDEFGRGVRWDDERDHAERRATTGLLLDLLGRLRSADTTEPLSAAANHVDPWFALWGALGLLRRGELPPPESMATAAADPEARGILFDQLSSMGRLEIMPESERTQSKLAESDMVRWLMYPTELGRPPDEIEQVAVVSMHHETGPADLYAFKFKTYEPHWSAKDGWMVGVAGPYLRREQPTSRSLGSTFSRFERFEEGKLRERIEANVGTISDWAGAHGERGPGSIPGKE